MTTALTGGPSTFAATESTDLALRDNLFVGGQMGYKWRLGQRIVVVVTPTEVFFSKR